MMKRQLQFLDYRWRYKVISFFNDLDLKGSRKLSLWLIKLLIPRAIGACCIRTKYGFLLQVNPLEDNGLEKTVYNTGSYEEGTLYVLANILGQKDTFVDVGANIGLMSLFASSIVGRNGKVISFEPHPKTLDILKRNISINQFDNIQISNLAIGDERKETLIYDYLLKNRGSSTLVKQANPKNSYLIEQTTLNAFFTHSAFNPSVIKLDIEGFELTALKGADKILNQEDHSPILIIECSTFRKNNIGVAMSEIYKFLIEKKYFVYTLEKGKDRISQLVQVKNHNEIPVHDNVFCFKKIHLSSLKQSIFK